MSLLLATNQRTHAACIAKLRMRVNSNTRVFRICTLDVIWLQDKEAPQLLHSSVQDIFRKVWEQRSNPVVRICSMRDSLMPSNHVSKHELQAQREDSPFNSGMINPHIVILGC
jgi:hypothetical protein